RSGAASSSRAAASGKRCSSWATIRRCCSWTVWASGWAKIVRTIVATKLCALLGTRVSRLRMKWVRHRCQAAPGSGAAIASTKAGMGIRGRQPDGVEAARYERAEEGEPGGAVLGGHDVEPERLAEAVLVDADRVNDADVDRPPTFAALDHQRVEG